MQITLIIEDREQTEAKPQAIAVHEAVEDNGVSDDGSQSLALGFAIMLKRFLALMNTEHRADVIVSINNLYNQVCPEEDKDVQPSSISRTIH